ncbi:molecular chaperone DnaJ [Bacillus toyonensis]|uniref:DnaJ domain-containing protein n=1 Tax=Bacillus toyonensis TaxID=155322 RepID=UPI000BFCD7DA|nr:DnaJ domain-containing protein [Bacillus toyonensis]PHE64471.1 molecular chaperone DnaJ [Bacillus toyonensis]
MNYEKALQVLEIGHNYTKDELKKQYRKLAKKAHPDLQGGSNEKFVELKEAFDYLSLGRGKLTAVHDRPKSQKVYHGSWVFDYELK